jgi:hypothetical protein
VLSAHRRPYAQHAPVPFVRHDVDEPIRPAFFVISDSVHGDATCSRLGIATGLCGEALVRPDPDAAVRKASARKRELRDLMKRAHLAHFESVAELAREEAPELARKFRLTRDAMAYLAFRTAARGMLVEAQARRELLVRYGLGDAVLDALVPLLDRFDAAVEEGTFGRRTHVGASADLEAVADEIVHVVRVMDGLNRVRFAGDDERLASWENASSVVAAPRPANEKPEGDAPGGEVRPAA